MAEADGCGDEVGLPMLFGYGFSLQLQRLDAFPVCYWRITLCSNGMTSEPEGCQPSPTRQPNGRAVPPAMGVRRTADRQMIRSMDCEGWMSLVRASQEHPIR